MIAVARPESSVDWQFESLPACPLCGSAVATTVFSARRRQVPLSFVKCVGCALVYQNPRLTPGALRDYFSSTVFTNDGAADAGHLTEPLGYVDYNNWDRSYARTAGLRLQHISRYVAPPARLLEVGPATGTFLVAARDAGYDVRGLDVSTAFARTTRERGLAIDDGFIETAKLPAATFDVVCCFGGLTCWHDPLRALANVRRVLRPGGVFVLNHMNVDNALYRAQGRRNWDYQPACLSLWSRRTMHLALARSGFDVMFDEPERQLVTLGRLAEYLRSPLLRAGVRALGVETFGLRVVVPFTRLVVCRPGRGDQRGGEPATGRTP